VSLRSDFPLADRILIGGLGAAGAWLAAAASAAGADRPPRSDPSGDDSTTVESVVVTGRRPGVTALTDKVQNTPQSINVLPAQVLHQQGVATLQDALKNVPGVTLNAGEGGAHGDTINLRGFPAADDFFLDGLRDTGFYTRDSFDLEAVEVYKGPASTLFGRGSTGGVVNQVSKAPVRHPIEAGALTMGTNDQVRGVADVNGVINDWAAFRLNAMGERSAVADRDDVLNRRWGLAPSLALNLSPSTSLVLSELHQAQDDIPDLGIPFVGDRPAPVRRQSYYGLPADDRFSTRVDVLTARLVHHVGDDLTLSESARYGRYGFSSRITAPHYDPAKVDPIAPPTDATPLDQILVYRDRPSVDGVVTTAMSESELTYRFRTGPLSHTLVAGVELDREDASLVRYANQISSGLTVLPGQIAPTSLLHPDPNEAFPGHQTRVTQRPVTRTDTASGFLIDTADLGAHWSLVAGVRLDRFHARFDEPLTNKHFERTDMIASPRAALVFKPADGQSYYLSYGTSYDPSAESLTLAASSQGLAPERDQTFEAGGKLAVLSGRLALTGAVFKTQMTNARITDPSNPALQTLAGSLNVSGAELGAAGYLTDKLEVLAGYTYLDGVSRGLVAPATAGGAYPTEPLLNTAHHQVNVWMTYEISRAFEIGTGVTYVGPRTADAAGRAHIPGYVTWDAMASYQLTPQLKIQVNAYNLTDAYYYTSSYYSSPAENHVVPGPGRTVSLTLAADF
jgi:catecholate siderophore receptor